MSFLNPSLTPDIYYMRSPLLFWAIISISCRRHEDSPSLLSGLSSHMMGLVWKTVSAFPCSLYTVQALVLICTWPFPTSSLWTDPSFILISIAKSTALQLGIHRPEMVEDFSRTKGRYNTEEIQEAVKTWAACFIAGQWFVDSKAPF
jgi:hypothetical protein